MSKSNEKNSQEKGTHEKKSGQPEPLSGSHKVKNRQHSRQKHNSHHDM